MITLILVSSLYRMKKTVFKKHGPPVPPSNQTAEHCLRYSLGIKKNLFYFFNEQIFYPLHVQLYTMYKDILKCTVMHKEQSYKLYSRILCTHLCTMYCGLQCTVTYNVQRYFEMYSYAQSTVI